MENKKMYVITMATGSYDDYGVSVVAVTDDFEKGSAYVNNLNSIYESLEKKLTSFQKNDMAQWYKDNPRPELAKVDLTPVPRWTGNQKITQEMRNERKKIEAENADKSFFASEAIREWGKRSHDFQVEWMKIHLTEEEKEMILHKNDNRWDIEETQWL